MSSIFAWGKFRVISESGIDAPKPLVIARNFGSLKIMIPGIVCCFEESGIHVPCDNSSAMFLCCQIPKDGPVKKSKWKLTHKQTRLSLPAIWDIPRIIFCGERDSCSHVTTLVPWLSACRSRRMVQSRTTLRWSAHCRSIAVRRCSAYTRTPKSITIQMRRRICGSIWLTCNLGMACCHLPSFALDSDLVEVFSLSILIVLHSGVWPFA